MKTPDAEMVRCPECKKRGKDGVLFDITPPRLAEALGVLQRKCDNCSTVYVIPIRQEVP